LFISRLKWLIIYPAVLTVLSSCTQTKDDPYERTKPLPVPAGEENPPSGEAPSSENAPVAEEGKKSDPVFFTAEPPAGLSVAEGAILSFSVKASGSQLSYIAQCASLCPSSLSVAADGGVSWETSYEDSGIYDVRFAAVDGSGFTAVSQYVRIRVTDANRAPVIQSVTVFADNETSPSLYTCDVSVTDPDRGDFVRVSRRWTVNGLDPSGGRLASKTVTTAALGKAGDVIRCEAIAIDQKEAQSDKVESRTLTIPNTPPVIISSGVILARSADAARVVPESAAAQTFRVGDAVRCAVSLYDKEGGDLRVARMTLVALPVSTPAGDLASRFSDVFPTADSYGSASEIVATFSGGAVFFSDAPEPEYFGRPFSLGGRFGVAYGEGSYTVEKKYAHRPLTCVSSLEDQDAVVTEASYATRVANSAPRIISISISPESSSPNVLDGASYRARTGGRVHCEARYDDADGDLLVQTVRFKSTRGSTERARSNPAVTWVQSCVLQTGVCTSTGIYTLKRWTDITGDESLKASLSDVHDDVISCATDVADITSYGSMTSSIVSGDISVQDSPPVLSHVTGLGAITLSDGRTASGSLSQEIHTSESYLPMTFLARDPDGDRVSYQLESVPSAVPCEDELISSAIDISYYPAAVLSQAGVTPPMGYPHRDRSCQFRIKASSSYAGSLPLASSPLKIALAVPNRAPKLYCGAKNEITPIILENNRGPAYQGSPATAVRRFLKTASEDIWGSPVAPGQPLGVDEYGSDSTDEALQSSVICTVVDLDGEIRGSSEPKISVLGSTASSSGDAFSWSVWETNEAGGCSYVLADNSTRESVLTSVFGLEESVVTRRLDFRMGVKSCGGKIRVYDGDPQDSRSLASNEVSFQIDPKINLEALSVALDPHCRVKTMTRTSLGDPDRYYFRTPDASALRDGVVPPLSVFDFPAFMTIDVTSSSQVNSHSDRRTIATVSSMGLAPVRTGTFFEMMSSPAGASFRALSRPARGATINPWQASSGYFLEDSLIGAIPSKKMTVSLSAISSEKSSGAQASSRTVSRGVAVTRTEATVFDLWSYPRIPSLEAGVPGFEGRQIVRHKTCASLESCEGQDASISSGETHTCYVSADGAVYCFGGNVRGQIGSPVNPEASSSFDARTPSIPFVKNAEGNCSDDYRGSSTPCQMNGSDTEKIAEVSVGVAHSCALTASGRVLCWGDNTQGQLGRMQNDDALPGDELFSAPQPEADYVYLMAGGTPEKLTGVTAIESGPWHTCALTGEKKVFCWGANPQTSKVLTDLPSTFCGPISTARCVRNPLEVEGMAGAVSITAGGFGSRLPMGGIEPGPLYIGGTTCAVTADRRTICMGDGLYGLRGSSVATGLPGVLEHLGRMASLLEDFILNALGRTPPAPVTGDQATVGVAIGTTTACALSERESRCWGGAAPYSVADPYGTGGGLSGLGLETSELFNQSAVLVDPEGSRAAQRTLGTGFSCEISSDENLRAGARCVGKNHYVAGASEQSVRPNTSYGALASGSVDPVVTRAQASAVCEASGMPLSDLVAISAGSFHTCAVRYDGAVLCWGSNFAGQTGMDGPIPKTPSRYARTVGSGAAVKRCSAVLRASFLSR
jgi:hypothetical protein